MQRLVTNTVEYLSVEKYLVACFCQKAKKKTIYRSDHKKCSYKLNTKRHLCCCLFVFFFFFFLIFVSPDVLGM